LVSPQWFSLYNYLIAILLLCVLNSGNVNRALKDDRLAEQPGGG
jgi:hypothetical protein